MEITLVVVRPFGPHAVGDRIASPDDIEAALGCDHAGCVVKVGSPTALPADQSKD